MAQTSLGPWKYVLDMVVLATDLQVARQMGIFYGCFFLELLYNTVDSRYFEVQGTVWNSSRYPYFDISDWQNWGKNKSNNNISQIDI